MHSLMCSSLEGLLISCIAQSWSKSLHDVWALAESSSDDSDDIDMEREIGTANGEPVIFDNVTVLRKPD